MISSLPRTIFFAATISSVCSVLPFFNKLSEQPNTAKVISEEVPSLPRKTVEMTDVVVPSEDYQFRVDWSNVTLLSPLALEMEQNQLYNNHCNPERRFVMRQADQINGLGYQLFYWSDYLCSALQYKAQLVFRGNWKWAQGVSEECDSQFTQNRDGASGMNCFFSKESRSHCPAPHDEPPPLLNDPRILPIKSRKERKICKDWLHTNHSISPIEFRAAAMEWLFSSVTPLVLEEGRKQLFQAFGPNGIPDPENLVTVHIRWGDKVYQQYMKQITIAEYIETIIQLVGETKAQDTNNPLHVYVTSEDPIAIQKFAAEKPKHWHMHTSGPTTAKANTAIRHYASGQIGLQSLGALLVSLEANYYVLTTKSFWSRLINYLRLGVVHPRCNSCTRTIDLNKGYDWA